MPDHVQRMPDEFSVFLTPEALHINRARLDHLASLGLDVSGKRVLEVGAGIGLHTEFFEKRGCDVLCTDGNPQNVMEIRRRYPRRKTLVLDLNEEQNLSHLGSFDVVYCYGTLYHLSAPDRAIEGLARVCSGLILIETCVTPGEYPEVHLVREPPANNMAVSSVGCRPTRVWVMDALRRHFGHAYVSKTQPDFPDFECDWRIPHFQLLHRAVFVGSTHALNNPALLDALPDVQTVHAATAQPTPRPCPPATNKRAVPSGRVLMDVGAHLGETSFEEARKDPAAKVYAFEPNLALATQHFALLPNYIVVPMAVTLKDGFAPFYLNSHDAASSLRPFNPQGLRNWIGGDVLKSSGQASVPTIRLETFMNAVGIDEVEFLKVDAQGCDFDVIRSAGDRLRDIRKVMLEVAVTPVQLYDGAADKETVVRYMRDHGFNLAGHSAQTHEQELNLVFERRKG